MNQRTQRQPTSHQPASSQVFTCFVKLWVLATLFLGGDKRLEEGLKQNIYISLTPFLEATRIGFHVFRKDINPLDLDAPNASAATHIYLFSDRPAPSRQTKGGGPLFDQPLS